MANQWFRLYAEIANDPKIQMMSEAYQRRWIMLLCIRCSNVSATLQDDEIAFQLRITQQEWSDTKAAFVQKNLIGQDNSIIAWDKRQYASDSSTERSKACRERKKQDQRPSENEAQQAATSCNVAATPPETDSETDTDTEKKETDAPARAPTEDEFCLRNWTNLAVEEWNLIAERHGLAKVSRLTDQRKAKLRARLRDVGIDGFRAALANVGKSAFLRGEKKDWRADFDFVVQEKSFTKLREGAYNDEKQPTQAQVEASKINLPAAIVERLRKGAGLTEETIKMWFSDAQFADGGRRIIVPTRLKQDWILCNYETALAAAFGGPIQIEMANAGNA